MSNYLNISFLKCVILVTIIGVTQGGNPCLTPEGEPGDCRPLHQCPSLYQHYMSNSRNRRLREYARRSECGFLPNEPKVCCHSLELSETNRTSTDAVVKSDLLPDRDTCGLGTTNKILYGGQITDLGDYPWMVLLDYEEPEVGTKYFNCGGALINRRYVLTAAHCITPTLKTIHLGVYDKTKNVSCLGGECNEPRVEIDVEEAIPFNSYSPRDPSNYHDIALVRMKKEVKYSDFIKPICLPLTIDEIFDSHEDEFLTMAGWGRSETGFSSLVKTKVDLPVINCSKAFMKRAIELGSGQICAGGEYGKDSCKGDSGGPLMAFKMSKTKDVHAHAVGVVSFGTEPCALYTPGVYTKVSNYVYWIVDNLKP